MCPERPFRILPDQLNPFFQRGSKAVVPKPGIAGEACIVEVLEGYGVLVFLPGFSLVRAKKILRELV